MNQSSSKNLTKTPKASTAIDYEQAFAQLESLVDSLENKDLALEEALKKFEQGIQLTGRCQKALNKAEQKVQLLMEKNAKLNFS
jgi:exodeoxyribonuclease VII small subunit